MLAILAFAFTLNCVGGGVVKHDVSCASHTATQTCTVSGPNGVPTMTLPAPSRVLYRDPLRHLRVRINCRPLI